MRLLCCGIEAEACGRVFGVEDFARLRLRYEQYWTRSNKRALVYTEAPRDNAKWYEATLPPMDYWFNTRHLVMSARHNLSQCVYAMDGYPHIMTSLGPDLMAGILGWELHYNQSSEWSVHRDMDVSGLTSLTYRQDNFYLTKMEEIMTALTEDARQGDYIVGLVDLNTLLDGLAALIGPQNLCYAMADDPEALIRAMDSHFQVYREIYTRYDAIARRYQGGSTNWLSVYSDVPWYFISLDFIVMLSDLDFMRFVEMPLKQMASFHGRNLFHLDGENAARHLDRLLSIPELTGIQVQCTPQVKEPVRFMIPHLKRILDAGKTAWIYAHRPEEVQLLMDSLPPEGLFIKTWSDTERDMHALEKRVHDFYGTTE